MATFEFQRYDPTLPNLESFDKAEINISFKKMEMVRCPCVEKLTIQTSHLNSLEQFFTVK